MAIKFHGRTKHGRVDFHPGVAYGFEDPDAEAYFKAAGHAEDTDDEPAVILSAEEIDIDPETVFADGPNKGARVLATVEE